MKLIRSRYDGTCRLCGRLYRSGNRIGWDEASRSAHCLPCAIAPGVSPEQAGASGRWWPEPGPAAVITVRTKDDRLNEVFLTVITDDEVDTTDSFWHAQVNGEQDGPGLVEELLERVGKRVLVGYDLQRTLDLLRTELAAAGGTVPAVPVVCLLQVGRRYLPDIPAHTLETLGRTLGVLDDDETPGPEEENQLAARVATALALRGQRTGPRHQIALSEIVTVPAPVPVQKTETVGPTPTAPVGPRVPWNVRNVPTGWNVTTTSLGSGDRFRSQVQIWGNLPERENGPAVAWLCAVAQKVLQRGEAPPAPAQVAALVAALPDVGASTESVPVPAGLHPTYEVPFWQETLRRHPELGPYLHPQAPLEALAPGDPERHGRRWVDFALCVPGMKPLVLELDGSGHVRSADVDAERDRELVAAGYQVLRAAGPELTDPFTAELVLAADAARNVPRTSARTGGASLWVRLTWALSEGLRCGLLNGQKWNLTLDDDLKVAPVLLGEALDFLQALDDLGSCAALPVQVICDGIRWERVDGNWEETGRSEEQSKDFDLGITFRSDGILHTDLPDVNRPHLVFRSCWLPVALSWANRTGPRRNVQATAAARTGLRRMAEYLSGHRHLREGQEESIMRTLNGEDLTVLLPTGGGKSLVYQVAGFLQPGPVLVVDPIVALIQDQYRRLTSEGTDRVLALSGQHQRTLQQRASSQQQLTAGDALFVLVAPERLQTKEFRTALQNTARIHGASLTVVDEAHCVSEWGHDFRTPYLRLGTLLRTLCGQRGPVPLLALTGTASPAVLRDVLAELGMDADRAVHPSTSDRKNLTYRVEPVRLGQWRSALEKTLVRTVPAHLPAETDGKNHPAGVVFVPWTNGDYGVGAVEEEIQGLLRRNGLSLRTGSYSGKAPRGKNPATWSDEKTATATAFDQGHIDLLVATKAFGMGIDKADIDHTTHLGFPSSIEAYAQEAGRAGRKGQPALCTLISTVADEVAARNVLDPRKSWTEFLSAARTYQENWSGARSDDLSRQLHFLTNSFPGKSTELDSALSVLQRLERGPRNGFVGIARDGSPGEERALHRLALIGVVEDYTIDYGARRYDVALAPYTAQTIDRALLAYLARAEPGRVGLHQEVLNQAPVELSERVRHHLGILVDTVYRLVGPARRNALAGIMDLARTEGDTQVREKILAYLDRGPLADLLDRIGSGEMGMTPGLVEISRVPASGAEWIGAAIRVLEDRPEDLVALLLRGCGEILRSGDDITAIGYLTECFKGSGVHGTDVLAWALAALRRRGPDTWSKTTLVWQAWAEAGQGDPAVLEDQVLRMAARGTWNLDELLHVTNRVLVRSAKTAETYTTRRIQ